MKPGMKWRAEGAKEGALSCPQLIAPPPPPPPKPKIPHIPFFLG